MARKSSVILTPAEKKLALASAKEAVKETKAVIAEATKARKVLDKEYAAAVKANDKELAMAQKAMNIAEASLAALITSRAVPSPTGI